MPPDSATSTLRAARDTSRATNRARHDIAASIAENMPSKMIDSEVPPGKMSEVVPVVSVTGPAPGNTRRDEGIQVRA